MPEKIPKHIGYGEGGQHLPSLAELLEAIVEGFKDIYDELDDLNPGERPLVKYGENFLEVEEISPDITEEVDKSSDIEIEFNKDIDYWKDKGTTEGEIEVKNLDSEANELDDIDISDGNTLVLKADGDWSSEQEFQVTIPKATVIEDGGDKLGMKEDLVFTFTTGE